MAIDLNKEHYPDNDGAIRTVYPENPDAEEIYPNRRPSENGGSAEAFPRNAQTDAPPRYAVPPVSSGRRVNYGSNFPAAPAANQPDTAAARHRKTGKLIAGAAMGLFGFGVLFVVIFAVAVSNIYDHSYDDTGGEVYPTFDYDRDYSYDEGDIRRIDFPQDGVSAISLADTFSDINITYAYTDSKYIHFDLTEYDDKAYKVDNSGGTITVTGGESAEDHRGRISVYLPSGYKGKVDVISSLSDIRCAAGKNINIKNDGGNVNLSELDADGVTVKMTDGDIYAFSSTVNSLSLSTEAGNVYVSGCDIRGEADIYTNNGDASVYTTASAGPMSIENGNGGIYSENLTMGDGSSVISGNGDIRLYNADFKSLFIKSGNGSVNVWASGSAEDYTVSSDIKNGKSNLPDNFHGKYALDVEVSNGNVSFEFNCDPPEKP